jgi:hypothetical protein
VASVLAPADGEDEEEGGADMDLGTESIGGLACQSYNGIFLGIRIHRRRNGRREYQFGRDVLRVPNVRVSLAIFFLR